MSVGDVMDVTATTVCPLIAEEAAHELVRYDGTVHIIGALTIYAPDVVKLVRRIDARHWLCRVSTATLVCLSTRNLQPSEVQRS